MSPESNPASSSRSFARLRTRPCAHGQALIPCASTPTTRRVPIAGSGGDAAEHDHLLGLEARHRRPPADRPLRADPDLGPQRVLALDDAARDLLREHLDEQRLAVDDEVDRALEELREARHVHALLVGGEVDRAVDRRRHHRLGVAAADPHCFLHAGDAGAREGEADLGLMRPGGRRRA